MLLPSFITLVLPALALPAPAILLGCAAAQSCAPTVYTLSNFTLSTLPAASVTFNFQSTFADSADIDDAVIAGAVCHAEGTSIPNNNECNVPNRKLLFDLRAAQEEAHYQITHTWVCNGTTWMSGTDVAVNLNTCTTTNNVTVCKDPQEFVPQNVRQICSTPTC
ncbi:hypothetical protein ACEQ8H_002700 [Pleosporales sp. CAS-2024a]